MTCKTNNGKIQVTAPKPESAYRVEAHTDNGSVYVNDNKVLNPYIAQNTQADTNLYAVSNNGSVRLELQIKNANKKADKKSVKVVSYLLFVIYNTESFL